MLSGGFSQLQQLTRPEERPEAHTEAGESVRAALLPVDDAHGVPYDEPLVPHGRHRLLEDVVTSGGALTEVVSAVREEGLVVRNAICVVDREEGGSDALARLGVRLRSLFRASELLEMRKVPGKQHG